MHQPTLFHNTPTGPTAAPVALAHRADPVSSHEAAKRVTRSAKAALHRQIVLALVQTFPSSTGHELWAACPAEQRAELETPNEVWRKLNDLRRAGLVIQGESRVCTVRKVRMVTWTAAATS